MDNNKADNKDHGVEWIKYSPTLDRVLQTDLPLTRDNRAASLTSDLFTCHHFHIPV